MKKAQLKTFGITLLMVIGVSVLKATPAYAEDPVDVTSYIKNASFSDSIDGTNWKVSYNQENVTYSVSSGEYGFTQNFVKAASTSKKFQNFTISQTVNDIPNGDYKFSAMVFGLDGTYYNKGAMRLYANGKSITCTRGAQAAESSIFVRVTDNTLTLKFTQTDNRNEVVGFGNVKLEFYGFRSWANIQEGANAYSVYINSQESLDDSFLKTDWAEGKDVNFILSNSDVEYYNLGTDGKAFPANHSNFAFRSADGSAPKVAGSLKPNALSVKNFTISGITFVADTVASSTQNDEASSICIDKNMKDSISGELLVTNCRFENIPASIARISGEGDGNYVHSMKVEYCYVDSMYHNLFQFDGGNGWGMSNFTFRENCVIYYQKEPGSLFNTAVSVKHPAGNDVYAMTVENNSFYKVSGDLRSDKYFLSCKNSGDWKDVLININNNIFYDCNAWDGGMHCGLALFDLAPEQNGEVNIMNNVLYPKNVLQGGYLDKFHVACGNVPVNRTGNLIADDKWNYTPDIRMQQSNPYFTGGVNGTYIGPRRNYYDFSMNAAGYVVDNIASFEQALNDFNTGNAKDLTIYFKNCKDACGYYALGMTGRKFPQRFGNVTFKNYEGATPKIAGSFRSSNGMKVDTYTVEGIDFIEGNMKGQREASPIYINKGVKDSIKNEIVIRNCTFTDMPASMIRINANGNENFINSILVENNKIDGIAYQLFQFAPKNTGLSNFTFRENVVKNMYATDGHLFNTPVSSKAPSGSDSIFTMTVEHNTFYKIGGKSASDCSFLECNNDNTWKEVYISINSNIFYDRYDWNGRAISDLKLFNKAEDQKVEVNILNNAMMPKNVMANADTEKYNDVSLPVVAGNIKPAFSQVLLLNPSSNFWASAELLKLWNDHPYYSMGIDGTYIGTKSTYISMPEVPEYAKYWWEATNEYHILYELGGKAVGLNPDGSNSGRVEYPQCGYSTISLNGKQFADDKPYIKVKLAETVAAGDTVLIAAFRSKGDATKKSNAYFAFNTIKISDGTDGLFYNDIVVAPQDTFTTWKFVLPKEADGAKEFRISRDQMGTNLFITKLGIIPAVNSDLQNYTLVLNDGIAYKSMDGGNTLGNAVYVNGLTYNATTGWTMNNFKFKTSAANGIVVKENPFIFTISGENSISTGHSTDANYGLRLENNSTLQGHGSLTVASDSSSAQTSVGVYAVKSLSIVDDVTVNASALDGTVSVGINVGQTLSVTGKAKVTAEGKTYGVCASSEPGAGCQWNGKKLVYSSETYKDGNDVATQVILTKAFGSRIEVVSGISKNISSEMDDVVCTAAPFEGNGGAVYNGGVLNLDRRVVFSNNIALKGGAIYNAGTVNLSDTVTLASATDALFNSGTLNWDLSGTSTGKLENYDRLVNDGGTLTITVANTQTVVTYSIASGEMNDCLTDQTGKYTFSLTGLPGIDDKCIKADGKPVFYGRYIFSLTVSDENGGSVSKSSDSNRELKLKVQPGICANVDKNVRYTKFEEAFAEVNPFETIELLSDAEMSDSITIPAGAKLNLNSFSLTIPAGCDLRWDLTGGNAPIVNGFENLTANGKLTIAVDKRQYGTEFIIAKGDMSDVAGKNFALTGLDGLDDMPITTGGKEVAYGSRTYALVTDDNGTPANKNDDLLMLVSNYTRKLDKAGSFGTICLERKIVATDGVEMLFVPTWKDSWYLYCVEVMPEETQAGCSYIFMAEDKADSVCFTLTDRAVSAPVNANNMLGRLDFDMILSDQLLAGYDGKTILENDRMVELSIGSTLMKNCAIIDLDNVPAIQPADIIGRRIIVFGSDGTTGIFELKLEADDNQKVEKTFVNGHIIILSGGKKYNLQGVELME